MIKQLLVIASSLFLFFGCGNTTSTNTTTNANNTQVNSTPTPRVFDNTIQELLYNSQHDTMNNATYICLGDSTRAYSEGNRAQLLFERVQLKLNDYNVTSHLLARGNHTLNEFITESISPTLSDLIVLVPNEGETTIVDISLGVNDFFALDVNNADQFEGAVQHIKEKLLQAIELIKLQKPKTTFLLTAPNPSKDWEQGAKLYHRAYVEVAKEQNYLFINYVDNIMPNRNEKEFSDWYHDNIHFSLYGLYQVADYILLNILPKE